MDNAIPDGASKACKQDTNEGEEAMGGVLAHGFAKTQVLSELFDRLGLVNIDAKYSKGLLYGLANCCINRR